MAEAYERNGGTSVVGSRSFQEALAEEYIVGDREWVDDP
jgi:hypothetical protein